ncbi:hypothetical protein BC829DRAFT_385061, partial [Chytridium lagenaria]
MEINLRSLRSAIPEVHLRSPSLCEETPDDTAMSVDDSPEIDLRSLDTSRATSDDGVMVPSSFEENNGGEKTVQPLHLVSSNGDVNRLFCSNESLDDGSVETNSAPQPLRPLSYDVDLIPSPILEMLSDGGQLNDATNDVLITDEDSEETFRRHSLELTLSTDDLMSFKEVVNDAVMVITRPDEEELRESCRSKDASLLVAPKTHEFAGLSPQSCRSAPGMPESDFGAAAILPAESAIASPFAVDNIQDASVRVAALQVEPAVFEGNKERDINEAEKISAIEVALAHRPRLPPSSRALQTVDAVIIKNQPAHASPESSKKRKRSARLFEKSLLESEPVDVTSSWTSASLHRSLYVEPPPEVTSECPPDHEPMPRISMEKGASIVEELSLPDGSTDLSCFSRQKVKFVATSATKEKGSMVLATKKPLERMASGPEESSTAMLLTKEKPAAVKVPAERRFHEALEVTEDETSVVDGLQDAETHPEVTPDAPSLPAATAPLSPLSEMALLPKTSSLRKFYAAHPAARKLELFSGAKDYMPQEMTVNLIAKDYLSKLAERDREEALPRAIDALPLELFAPVSKLLSTPSSVVDPGSPPPLFDFPDNEASDDVDPSPILPSLVLGGTDGDALSRRHFKPHISENPTLGGTSILPVAASDSIPMSGTLRTITASLGGNKTPNVSVKRSKTSMPAQSIRSFFPEQLRKPKFQLPLDVETIEIPQDPASKKFFCPVNDCFAPPSDRKYNIKTHLYTHYPKVSYRFPCPYCEKIFTRHNDMERHSEKKHRSEEVVDDGSGTRKKRRKKF